MIRKLLVQEVAPYLLDFKSFLSSFLPISPISERPAKNHKTSSIMEKGQDKWGTRRNFVYHRIRFSDIWDHITSLKQEQKRENLQSTLRNLKMIVEIKWAGSERLENLSGHRINRPPQKRDTWEKRSTEEVCPTGTGVPARDTEDGEEKLWNE